MPPLGVESSKLLVLGVEQSLDPVQPGVDVVEQVVVAGYQRIGHVSGPQLCCLLGSVIEIRAAVRRSARNPVASGSWATCNCTDTDPAWMTVP